MTKKHNYYNLMNDIKAVINEYQNDPEIGGILKSFDNISDSEMATVVFDGDLGARYRIVIPYNDKNYGIAWIEFTQDCSVYFGVRKESTEKRRTGSVKSVDGKITINTNEEYLPPLITDAPTKDRFSFHGSGEIHCSEVGRNTFRPSIRQAQEQSELFTVAFEKISNLDEAEAERKTDIRIPLNILENQILILRTYIAPTNKVKLIGVNEGAPHFFVIINFPESDAVQPLSLILVFSTILAEPSLLDRTIVVWPTIE